MLVAFGDSITAGYGISPASSRYVDRLALALGITQIQNLAVNGAQAGDQAFAAYAVTPDPANIYTIMVGTNDERLYGTDATKRGYFLACLRSNILQVALPAKVTARSGSMSLTGTWANTVVNSVGKNTTALGNKATATVSGSTIYVGTILQADPSAGASAIVRVDGVQVGTIDATATGITTYNGLSYPPGVFRFAGLSSGAHTVEVEVSTSGKIFYLDWIAGSSQAQKPPVYVANVIRMSAAGYAGNGGSDANVATYNAAIAQLVSELAADGLNVHLVDVWSVIDPATDLIDGVHPNLAAQDKLRDAWLSVIQSGVTFTAAPVYARSTNGVPDGTFWIGDGTARKQLTTTP